MLRATAFAALVRSASRCITRQVRTRAYKQPSHFTNIKNTKSKLPAPYWCGGSMQVPGGHSIGLCLISDQASKQPSPMRFPMQTDQQLQDLMAACKAAVFGKGDKDVLDPSYRKALALDPNDFLTNFDLTEYGILDTIRTILMPDAASITAELYKLNVYRPGDFFRPHVDTPRGENMFGSLVICLPQAFTGGQLQLSHLRSDHEFDWSKAASNGCTVQWAAFYSDCRHEILPVETGHRVTLTYNLYATQTDKTRPSLPELSCQSVQLYEALITALKDPYCMPTGGRIGLPCVHHYPHTHDILYKSVPSMLKGQDALCFKVLEQAGLEVSIQAIWNSHNDEYCFRWKAEHFQNKDSRLLCATDLAPFEENVYIPGSQIEYVSDFPDYDQMEADLETFIKKHDATDVFWIRDEWQGWPSRSEQAAYMNLGNQHMADVRWTVAAIVATVPAWDSDKRIRLAEQLKWPRIET